MSFKKIFFTALIGLSTGYGQNLYANPSQAQKAALDEKRLALYQLQMAYYTHKAYCEMITKIPFSTFIKSDEAVKAFAEYPIDILKKADFIKDKYKTPLLTNLAKKKD